jgi:hypothetical protein
MIGMNAKVEFNAKAIEKPVEKGAYTSFSHAAGSIRKTAQAKVVKSPVEKVKVRRRNKAGKLRTVTRAKRRPSRPGTPPHTRAGQARRAIIYAADKTGAYIGFRHSAVGTAMGAHEHGEKYKGANYPERPTMGPSLEENLTRFAASWQGSIGA